MSPREKGRYLRAGGWTPCRCAGRVYWQDPRDRCRGVLGTSDAYDEQRARKVTP